ncbi:MAG: DUF2169 domain-containing protein [Myxococcales bacterium]|nr:DUF2169 domain-containing protein [Myxococcales bacterium]
MKVVKPVKVAILSRVVELLRKPQLHVAAMLGFPLRTPRKLIDEVSLWPAALRELGEGGVLDEGIAKARGEVLVAGSFFAPGGAPLPASYVRARVGRVDKRLSVIGDRVWRDAVPTEPVPMSTMPIDWAHAFGGAEHERNRHGKGAHPIEVDGKEVHPLPNVERYGALVRSPRERPEPACFLPMDVTFPQRRERAGSYDKRWLEEHFPGLPPDHDPTFFNLGAEDQWDEGFFRGDEELLLENMHPDEPRIEGRLPGLRTRAFVDQARRDGRVFAEVPMRCDTVWLLPSAGIAVVVFHGSVRVRDDDAADVVNLVVACEDPAAPRAAAHYEDVLRRRLDDKTKSIAILSDSDLMPPRESGVAPNLGETDVGQWVKAEHLLRQNMRRGQERQFAEARARVEAEGLDPADHGLAALPPEEPLPPEDLDELAAFVAAQAPSAETERAALEAEQKKIEERARAELAELGRDYDAEMALARREAAGPPRFSAARQLEELRDAAEKSRAAGVPQPELEARALDPAYRAELEAQEAQLRDMYRRTAHLQDEPFPMDEADSAQARVVVQAAVDGEESLAERNFTGARLRNMRLAGIDLARAYLEATDLSGCDLAGANLEGAVLARANLRGCSFAGAKLAGANLGAAELAGADFTGADLGQAVFSGATLGEARFAGAKLDGADFEGTKLAAVDLSGTTLEKCSFLSADLSGARFRGCKLDHATFIKCRLDGVDFGGASLHKATLVESKGRGVSFRGARCTDFVVMLDSALPEADFSDAVATKLCCRGVDLRGARFDRADLADADLSECDLEGASLDRAVLVTAMLIRTKLDRATLRGANLREALASKAVLRGADFTGANLYQADLSRAVGDDRTSFAEAEVGKVRFLPKANPPEDAP